MMRKIKKNKTNFDKIKSKWGQSSSAQFAWCYVTFSFLKKKRAAQNAEKLELKKSLQQEKMEIMS
jgi:hypothetical protein